MIYQIHVSFNNKISVNPCELVQETPKNYIVKVEGCRSDYVVRKTDINELFNYNMVFCDNVYDGLNNLKKNAKKEIEEMENSIIHKKMLVLNIRELMK